MVKSGWQVYTTPDVHNNSKFPIIFYFRSSKLHSLAILFLKLLKSATTDTSCRSKFTLQKQNSSMAVHIFNWTLCTQSRGISRSIDNRKAHFFEIEFNSYFCMTAILVSHNNFLFRSYLPQSLDSDNVLANASEMTATTAEGKNDCPLGLFCYHLWVCHCHRPHSRYKLKLFPTKTHL